MYTGPRLDSFCVDWRPTCSNCKVGSADNVAMVIRAGTQVETSVLFADVADQQLANVRSVESGDGSCSRQDLESILVDKKDSTYFTQRIQGGLLLFIRRRSFHSLHPLKIYSD